MNRFIRNSINLGLCLTADAACVGIALTMLVANYMACQVSFELLGYDRMPLRRDGLLGGFFDIFLSNATLTHLYAFTVAVMVSLGLFLMFHSGFRLFDHWRELKYYRHCGEDENAELMAQTVKREAIILLAIAIFTIPVLIWDVQLFLFRSIAGAASIEDPSMATQLPNWGLQLQENRDLWVVSMARVGAWGYISVTAIACFALEFAMRKTGESWARLADASAELFKGEPDPELEFYGYDAEGQPVYEPETPIAYDTEGNPISRIDEAPEGTRGETEISGQPSQDAANPPLRTLENEPDTTNVSPKSGETQPLFEVTEPEGLPSGKRGAEENSKGPWLHERPSGPASSRRQRAVLPVLGLPEDAAVDLATALSRPDRYWVDPDDPDRIWDVSFRKALLEESGR